MNSLLLLVASVAVGIDYGYQPLESGGLEYIIQFEPQQLDALNEGMDLVSEVPPDLDIRRYRIQVGTEKLPRILGSQAQKRGVSAGKRGASGGGPAARDHADSATHDVASEPAKNEFETTRRGAAGAAARDQADAEEADGPALVGEPAGPDKTFSSEDRDNPFTAGSFLDRNSPRKLKPADDANPLPSKSIAAAGFADRDNQRDDLDGEDAGTRSANKPSLSKESEAAEVEKPWMTLVWTIAALCVSLGLNVYLGWIAWTARERYRLLLERSPDEPVEV